MGLWEMGTGQSAAKAYTPLVSIGPLPADYGVISRRSQLQQINRTLTAGNGTLALNDAILAAYKTMTQTYKPNYVNAVLVLTAGVDNAPGDMSLTKLLAELRRLYNPNRKVELVILMFGQRGNFGRMQQIAAATSGVAYQISNPSEVGKVFFEAVSQRMCDQGCTLP
jgi:Mg-chelatase subunit ChlD